MKIPENLMEIFQTAQNFQGEVQKAQEDIRKISIEASAGGGMVSAVFSGDGEVTKLTIDPTVVDPKDIHMLQDLVIAAINQGIRRSREVFKDELAKRTGAAMPQLMQFLNR